MPTYKATFTLSGKKSETSFHNVSSPEVAVKKLSEVYPYIGSVLITGNGVHKTYLLVRGKFEMVLDANDVKDTLESLLQEVLNYHNGVGKYSVSGETDEGETLGELWEDLQDRIEEALSAESSSMGQN